MINLVFDPIRGPELPFHFKSLEHIACFCRLELLNNQIFLQVTIVSYHPFIPLVAINILPFKILILLWQNMHKIYYFILKHKVLWHLSIFTMFCN